MATNNNRNNNATGSSNRGFASMDSDRQREIASMGGKAAHEKGTAHQFDSAEAQAAGRRGGKASHSSGNRSTAGGPQNNNSNASRSRNSQSESGSDSDTSW